MNSKYPPKGIEWSRRWNLEAEIGIASVSAAAHLFPLKLKSSTIIQDQGMHLKLLLVESSKKASSSNEKKKGSEEEEFDPLAPETAEKTLIIRDSVFEEKYAILLNKFPVFAGHSLLVARGSSTQMPPQNAVLTRQDLDALHRCALAARAIAFYNSHPEAGSSQPHRHFQFVPMASIDTKHKPPIYSALDSLEPEIWRWSSKAPYVPIVRRLPAFNEIEHGIVKLPDRATYKIDFQDSTTFAHALLRAYIAIATDIGLLKQKHTDDFFFDQTQFHINNHPSLQIDLPYNLLLTTDFILLVRRSKSKALVQVPFTAMNSEEEEHFFSSSVATSWTLPLNGLAFAGTIAVNDQSLYNFLSSSSSSSPLLALLKDVSTRSSHSYHGR